MNRLTLAYVHMDFNMQIPKAKEIKAHKVHPTCLLLQQDVSENSKAPLERDEDEEEKAHEVECSALTGSLSVQYGCSNPHLYSQFSLRTRDQKLNQIILIQVTSLFNPEQII